ncbi:39S ribosomal protein L20, mitochondrial [Carassius carassius]|uniref:39S ribosomal protein L20, mitochondrial n=1 Tax=Carassius carassius TaxID=217509 RepID=UPI00286916E1|nr:39S ribosomal protein L20, mitochondrial [Carassius carassius]
MVFLTLSCWTRNRGPDRYWRVQELLKSARHFRGRKNRCYSLAVRAVRRAFIYASKARKAKRRSMRQLWIQRLAAASREQHMKYPALIHNLLKCSVELNRRVLCDLSITEPRSFQALTALAQARRTEGLRAALGEGAEPPGVFSRITQLQGISQSQRS